MISTEKTPPALQRHPQNDQIADAVEQQRDGRDTVGIERSTRPTEGREADGV